MFDNLLKSFMYAFNGLGEALISERNFRLQWLMALMASLLIYLVQFEFFAQMLFLMIIFGVLSLELLNSSIEKICDSCGTEHNAFKKKAKDFAAASVLLASILSLLVFFSIAYGMYESMYLKIMKDPMVPISMSLIFMGNVPLCLIPTLSPYALMLLVPNLVLHMLFLVVVRGEPLFLCLSIIFHLSLALASIRRAFPLKS